MDTIADENTFGPFHQIAIVLDGWVDCGNQGRIKVLQKISLALHLIVTHKRCLGYKKTDGYLLPVKYAMQSDDSYCRELHANTVYPR